MKKYILLLVVFCVALFCGINSKAQGIYPFAGMGTGGKMGLSYYSPLVYGNATYSNDLVHTVNSGPVQYLTDTSALWSNTAASLDIDSIPDQMVFYNTTREFYIKSAKLLAAGKTIVGQIWQTDTSILKNLPLGTAFFNRYNLFSYTTNSDTLDFYLKFKLISNKGDTVASAPVHFKVVPTMPFETSTFGIGGTHKMPDANDPEYLIRTLKKLPNKHGTKFNFINDTVRTYSFSGVTVVLDSIKSSNNSELTGLSYNWGNATDLDTLNIYAETVVVRNGMWFPGTTINIYAKELRFEDLNGHFAYLMTTPLNKVQNQIATGAGETGLDGGNINLHVLTITANPGRRLITNGGDGQGATVTTGNTPVIGLPGNGGDISSVIDVSSFVLMDGGYSGNKTYDPAVTYRGNAGVYTTYSDSIATWLHPNFFKVLVNYYKDGYYNGLTDPISINLKWYSDIFDQYSNDSSFSKVSVSSVQELKHSVDEIRKCFYNINNNLDYFGYPAGWVPMLSFEVAQSVYSAEVNHAMNILFLEYLVNRANTSFVNRRNAMSKLQDESQALAKSNLDLFNNIATVIIPEEKRRMVDDSLRIDSVTNALQDLNDELNRKAQEMYDSRHNLFAEVLGAVATVCSMIPTPITQGIGKGLNATAQALGGDLATSFNNGQGIAKDVVNFVGPLQGAVTQDFSNIASNLSNSYSSISSSLTQFGTALGNGNLGTMQSLGGQISSQCFDIYNQNKPILDHLGDQVQGAVDLFNKITKTDEGELGSIRGQLVASDPRVKDFQEEIQQIQMDQQKLAQQLQQSTVELYEAQNNVMSNLAAVSRFNSAAYDADAAINHFLTVYAHDLSRKAVERLRKYHYYMGKAYEYRTLQAFNGNLNMQSITNQIKTLIEDSSRTQLATSDYNAIKAVYDQEVYDILDNIYTYYQSNKPAQTITTTYRLSKDEVASLNSGKPVKLNLVEAGVFRASEEDIRIVGLRVSNIINDPIPSNKLGNTDNVDFDFSYPNYSKIKKNGIIYNFNNYNINTQYPISWKTRYDIYNNLKTDAYTSATANSLLSNLLVQSGHSPSSQDDILLYSRPAAWADISLTMNHQTNSNDTFRLDSLVIEVKYDYLPKPSNMVNVQLNTNNKWFAPTFDLSLMDNNGNKAGSGDVHRSYNTSTSNFVKATAPMTYGRYKFSKWTDQNGYNVAYGSDVKAVSGVPNAINFSVGKDRYFKASYVYDGPALSLPDTVYLGDSLKYQLHIANTGTGAIYWQVDTSKTTTSWIKYNGKLIGLNDTTINITFNKYRGCAKNRIGVMNIVSTETEALNHYIVFVQGPKGILDTTSTQVPSIPTISIIASDTIISAGASVQFTATALNGGNIPSYQWYVNNVAVLGASTSVFVSSTLKNSDTVRCRLISSASCITDTLAYSNKIVEKVAGAIIIAGNVITPLNKAINNAQISYTGTTAGFGNSINTGIYTINLGKGNYSLHANKNNDINKANGVTTLDIALIQSHILSKTLLSSPYKLIAADVNGDNKVTTLDIVYMKRLILGLDTTFTNSISKQNRLWSFVDSSYVFPVSSNPFPFKDSISYTGLSASKINQTFIGCKLGDVNWDWNPSLARPMVNNLNAVELSYEPIKLQNEKLIRIPIKVKNFKDLLSIQYTLNFNPAALKFVGVNNIALNTDIGTNHAAEGKVSFLWVDAKSEYKTLEDGSILFELVFERTGKEAIENSLSIDGSITTVVAYDKDYQSHDVVMKRVENIQSLQQETWVVAPNPTKDGVIQVQMNLSNKKTVVFRLLDNTGRLLLTKQVEGMKGSNSITLREGNILSGIYYLQAVGVEGVKQIRVEN